MLALETIKRSIQNETRKNKGEYWPQTIQQKYGRVDITIQQVMWQL